MEQQLMKVACISITYNDDYKIDEWYEHYLQYKNDIYLHIIVNNNSSEVFSKKLNGKFAKSTILNLSENKGCTGAYNAGIKYALEDEQVDTIMLLANDIKLGENCIPNLYEAIKNDPQVGMVAPIMFEGNSLYSADFGCSISSSLLMKPYLKDVHINDIVEDVNYCDAVTGGVNLASRDFYEKVGMQDELLFMYSDEVDMGIRAKEHGFKMMCIKTARAWHMHINAKTSNGDRREIFTRFLSGRNKVYVARKHYGYIRSFYVFIFLFLGSFSKIISQIIKGKYWVSKDYLWIILGSFYGLFGNMTANRFSKPRESHDSRNRK